MLPFIMAPSKLGRNADSVAIGREALTSAEIGAMKKVLIFAAVAEAVTRLALLQKGARFIGVFASLSEQADTPAQRAAKTSAKEQKRNAPRR